jgi:hypothetical protein
MNKPLIKAEIDQGGRLRVNLMTAAGTYKDLDVGDSVKGITVTNRALVADAAYVFKISNYHFCDTYRVRTDNGSVSIVGDTVTYTPGVVGVGGFWVNGSFQEMTIIPDQPYKPSVTYPAPNQTEVLDTALALSSAFSAPPNRGWVHARSRWQIATDPDFANILLNTESSSVLLSFAIYGVASKTTYYVRVRHIGSKP